MTNPAFLQVRQDETLKRVMDADGLDARDRAAAVLILVFGQQTEIIARLTWNDVTITEELVTSSSEPSRWHCRIHWTSLGATSPQTRGTS